MKKRILAALLLAAMMVTVLPTAAFAEDVQPVEEIPVISEEPAPETSEEPAPEVNPEPSEEVDPEPEEEGQAETITEVNSYASFEEYAMAVSANNNEYAIANADSACAADEYASCRLIVRANSDFDATCYNALKAIEGPDGAYILQFADADTARAAAAEIATLSGIEYVEPDKRLSLEDSAAETFADSVGQDQASTASSHNSWGINNIGADYFASWLKSNGYTSTIYVAVVDTGVNASHTYLSGRVVPSLGYDFYSYDTDPDDEHGHGSHCSGTIVDCTLQLTNVKIIPVRVLGPDGSGWSSDVGDGIEWAANKGAKVISLSLGGGHSDYKDEAIEYAINKGVTCVVAAGNDTAYVDTSDDSTCPAHIAAAITVAALDDDETDAWYSNYGPAIDVAAPGTDIYSVDYEGGYCYMSGTSMATPHVAALCAMLKLYYPSYTPAQIQSKIKTLCRDLGSSGFDNIYGYGIPDMHKLSLSTGTWKQVGGYWYYYVNGSAVKNTWKAINGSWYHFDSTGKMQTGWLKLSGKWYYLKSTGAMAKGWLKVSGKWYYFDSTGAMKTKWGKVNGKWYYFGTSGAMQTGWLTYGGHKYYLKSSGAMACNETLTIGGVSYYFDSNGYAYTAA